MRHKHTYTNCIDCGDSFSEEFFRKKYIAKGLCYTCYYKNYSNKVANQPKVIKRMDKYTIEYLSYSESMQWVEDRYKNKLIVDLMDLSNLILVYDSLGGSHHYISEYEAGEQFQSMWEYVNEKYLDFKNDKK